MFGRKVVGSIWRARAMYRNRSLGGLRGEWPV